MTTEIVPSERPSNKVGKLAGTNREITNYHGHWFVMGDGFNVNILNNIQNRIDDIKQNIIVVAGSPGGGKTYFALRLAQIFDKRFNVDIQVVFDRSQLLYLLGPESSLHRGQTIIIDESQFAMSARAWMEQVQKDLMQHMQALRSKGLLVVIVCLHTALLDKIVRQHILSMEMWMNKRGQAAVYEFTRSPFIDEAYHPKLGNLVLQIPDIEKCAFPNCLVCKFRRTCMTDRARYERNKKAFLDKMNTESRDKDESKKKRKAKIDLDMLLGIVVANKEKIQYVKSTGNADKDSVSFILEDHGIDVDELSDTTIAKLVKRGVHKRPDIFKQQRIEAKKDEL